jgi:hypothetical protein
MHQLMRNHRAQHITHTDNTPTSDPSHTSFWDGGDVDDIRTPVVTAAVFPIGRVTANKQKRHVFLVSGVKVLEPLPSGLKVKGSMAPINIPEGFYVNL